MNDSGIELSRPIQAYRVPKRPDGNVEFLSPEMAKDVTVLGEGMPSLSFDSSVRLLESGTRLKSFNSKSRSQWLSGKKDRGFIRVYDPNSTLESSVVVPLTLNTTAQQVASQFGLPPYSLHIQYSGDLLRRLTPDVKPLFLQDNFLERIGIREESRRREIGDSMLLGYALKFYAGRPFIDDGFGNSTLTTYCQVRKGRIFQQWSRRLCTLDGARLLIYPGISKMDIPEAILLSRSKVEESFTRGRGRCIKITAVVPFRPLQIVYLSFDDTNDFNAWISRCVKAAAKVPPISDLSNLQLECLPEQVFCIGSERLLTTLNLKRNHLQTRPQWEHLRAIGWLEDLPRLQSLRSLNLSDNDLGHFPEPVIHLQALIELNLSSNGIPSVPEAVGKMKTLASLNLQNNKLQTLPDEMAQCRSLQMLDLSFNHFETMPIVLCEMAKLKYWNLAGCVIASIAAPSVIIGANHVKKLDLRLNKISAESSIFLPSGLWQSLAHLDLRRNIGIEHLDLTSLPSLQSLNLDDNLISHLVVNGTSLTRLSACRNALTNVVVIPIPTHLKYLILDNNKLTRLPEWISDVPNIEKISAANNKISTLPIRIFTTTPYLKHLNLHHNLIRFLPQTIENSFIEWLDLHHNKLRNLPELFLASLHKLKYLNLAQNFLKSLPPLNSYLDLNKVQYLILAANHLDDSVMQVVTNYRRLKVLDLGYNNIRCVADEDISRLANLDELSLVGNRLTALPASLASLSNLRSLRAHSNNVSIVPDLTTCESLRIVDLANNKLDTASMKLLMAPGLQLLDLSCNSSLKLDKTAFKDVEKQRAIAMIDVKEQTLSNTLRPNRLPQSHPPWQIGFCETSGSRNRLCIKQIRQKAFVKPDGSDVFLGLIDGGLNSEIPTMLTLNLPDIIKDRFEKNPVGLDYLHDGIIKAHLDLRSSGQRLGASVALCHILTPNHSNDFHIRIANLGNVEVVTCRSGDALVLSQKHTISRKTEEGVEEFDRVRGVGGIFTENDDLDGITPCTRMIGNSFLYPSMLPRAYTSSVSLSQADEFIILATRSLWDQISYDEAVRRIRYIANPILAAKHLQDMAQSYGCSENLSIIVVRFFFNSKIPEPPTGVVSNLSFSGSLRGRIYSALHMAESDESISAIDEVKSEPRGKDAIRERPNYYFEYKKQLKELCDSETTIYSSQLSELSDMSTIDQSERDDAPTPTLTCMTPVELPSAAQPTPQPENSFRAGYCPKSGSTSSSGIGRSEHGTVISITETKDRVYNSRTCSSPDFYVGYFSNNGIPEQRQHTRTYSFGNLEEGMSQAKPDASYVLREIAF